MQARKSLENKSTPLGPTLTCPRSLAIWRGLQWALLLSCKSAFASTRHRATWLNRLRDWPVPQCFIPIKPLIFGGNPCYGKLKGGQIYCYHLGTGDQQHGSPQRVHASRQSAKGSSHPWQRMPHPRWPCAGMWHLWPSAEPMDQNWTIKFMVEFGLDLQCRQKYSSISSTNMNTLAALLSEGRST